MHVIYRLSALQYLTTALQATLIGSEVRSGIHEYTHSLHALTMII